MAWTLLVPLFVGFVLVGLLLFKRMDRGSAIKKLVVRVLFIGLGLPVAGSLYSAVLNDFDDSLMGQQAAPTRVVLQTYTDFGSWMMNDRLAVPAGATIGWDEEKSRASVEAQTKVRDTALAINTQSNDAFTGFTSLTGGKSGTAALQAGMSTPGRPAGCTIQRDGQVTACDAGQDGVRASLAAVGMLCDFVAGHEVNSSDFESGIKAEVRDLDLGDKKEGNKIKKSWFIGEVKFKDEPDKATTDATGPVPSEHPLIASAGGLTAAVGPDGSTVFPSPGVRTHCKCTVVNASKNGPAACNLSPQDTACRTRQVNSGPAGEHRCPAPFSMKTGTVVITGTVSGTAVSAGGRPVGRTYYAFFGRTFACDPGPGCTACRSRLCSLSCPGPPPGGPTGYAGSKT